MILLSPEMVTSFKETENCWILLDPPTNKPNQIGFMMHSRLFIRSADLKTLVNDYDSDHVVSEEIHGHTENAYKEKNRQLSQGLEFLWNHFQQNKNATRFQSKTDFLEHFITYEQDAGRKVYEMRTLRETFPKLSPLKKS